jgi:hypothetical protein
MFCRAFYSHISRNLVWFPCDFRIFQLSCSSVFYILMSEVHKALSRREYEFVTNSRGEVELELRISFIMSLSLSLFLPYSVSFGIHFEVVAQLHPFLLRSIIAGKERMNLVLSPIIIPAYRYSVRYWQLRRGRLSCYSPSLLQWQLHMPMQQSPICSVQVYKITLKTRKLCCL